MKSADLYKIHISVFLFGFAGLFGKWIYLDALSIVWGRVLFASLAFGVLFAFQGRNPFKISLKQFSSFLFLGGLLAFHWWSFFMGIQKSTVAIGLFSFASFPVFTVLLESLFFNEKWKSQYFFLALLSLLGISLLLPDLNWNNEYLQGVIWGVLSGFSFALLTIYNRKLLPKSSAIEIAFFQDLFAFIILTPFILYQVESIGKIAWFQLLILGTIFTALTHVLYISGLKTIKARQAALISNLEPIYGLVFAYVLLGENLHWKMLLGGALILLAAVYASFISSDE